jgi:hypothetical protein
MVIFHSFLYVYQRVFPKFWCLKSHGPMVISALITLAALAAKLGSMWCVYSKCTVECSGKSWTH